MAERLDNYEVTCSDENVVALLKEGVLACLDNNDKDDFDVYFLRASLGTVS